MPKLAGAFEAFSNRNYRLLWSGSLFSVTAFMMTFMLVPSVAFDITGSNAAAGIAQMGSGISMIALAPIGGAIADRVHKKPIVLAGQVVPAIVILGTGLLIIADLINVPLLTLGTLIMGLGFAFMGPARQAWVGELVKPTALANAVALQQIALNIAQVAAPLMIALLVGTWIGVGGTYLFMASLFLVVLPLTLLIPNTPPTEREQRPIREELTAGVSYVVGDLRLRVLWLSLIGLVLCGFAFQTLLPGLLDQELGRDPTDIGLIFLTLALAGLLINFPLAALVGSRLAWPLMLLMGLVMGAGFFAIATAPTYGLVILASIPLGIGRAGFLLVNNALLMANTKPEYFGRVMSLAMMAFGGQALLAPLWGIIADLVGVRETLFAVGVAAIVVTALAFLAWLPSARAAVRYPGRQAPSDPAFPAPVAGAPGSAQAAAEAPAALGDGD